MELRFQWQSKRPSPGSNVILQPCSDCRGLKDGTRSDQDPHEYLLHVGHSESDARMEIYRCLVCDSTLMREPAGAISIWS